jgi:hypothetical protein
MGQVFPMPTVGDLFTDMRGDDRRMRVSYHEDRGVVVVSLWADTVCRGTFQLAAGDVARLVAVLSQVGAPVGSTSAPEGHDAAGEAAPRPAPASPELTGDVNMAALPPSRVPRVA